MHEMTNLVEIFETMENELPLLNNDLKRNNEDKCLNTYGKLLLEMCKSKKLIIVKGRIGDNLSGKFTWKGLSTVDSFLCDYSIFKFVSNMQVLEHSKLFSDVHTPIVLYLDLPENTNDCWLIVKKESNPGILIEKRYF